MIGQFTSLTVLTLRGHDQLTSLPAEIGQLASLVELDLGGNQLTSLPAEIGQLTSLTELDLYNNQLTSLPAEIGQLTSLTELWPQHQSADELAGWRSRSSRRWRVVSRSADECRLRYGSRPAVDEGVRKRLLYARQ